MNPKELVIAPTAALRPWVSEFRVAVSSSAGPAALAHLPGGEAGLFFRTTGEGAGDLSAVGPLRRARYKSVSGVPFYVRVCLRPGRARRVLGVPLNEIADRIVPLEELWRASGKSLCARLIDGGPNCVGRLLEEALSQFMARRRIEPAIIVSQLVRAIDEDPSTRMDEHARATGMSPRQLRHLFRVELGMSPKRYARIARLKRLLAATDSRATWAERAADAGFYDQAHMIADFHDLLGVTPEAALFLQQRGPDQLCH